MASTDDLMRLAAAQEQLALDTRERNSRGGVPIPGGRLVPIESFKGISALPTLDATRYLAEPEKWLIKDPKPGKYVWAAYDEKYGGDMTSSAIRSRRYTPVTPDQLKDKYDFDLHFKTHTGTTKYVHWRSHILCYMTPEEVERQYDLPVAMYLRNMGALQDNFKSDIEVGSGGQAVAHASQHLSQG